MSYRKLDLIQGTPEWRAARFNYVTASNVPAVFGVSPYKTPREYMTELLTREEKTQEGKAELFAQGHRVEAAAREWVRSNLGYDLQPATIVSNRLDCLLASLDGMDEDKRIVFEAKFVGADTLRAVRAGSISAHHRLQVEAQLLATGFERAIYFAMDSAGEHAIVDVALTDPIASEITTRVAEFWSNAQAGRLPDPGPRDILLVEDDLDLALLARVDHRISLLRAQLEPLEATYKETESRLAARYPGAGKVQGNGVTMTTFWQKGNVDWQKLSAALRIPALEQDRFRKAGSLRRRITIKEQSHE